MSARVTGRRIAAVLGVLAVGLAATLALAAAVGVEAVDPGRALVAGTVDHAIFMRARLPRVLLGALVGGALAASGVAFQALLRNPLADPYVLGVSAGAAIVVTLLSALGLGGTPLLGGFAFLGALGAVMLVYSIGRVRGRFVPTVALLAGVVFNAFAGGLMYAVVLLLSPERAQELLSWIIGALDTVGWGRLGAAAGWVGLGLVVLHRASGALNALAYGDEAAHAVGVDVNRTRKHVFLAASLLTGAAVAVSGPIGFVGIVVPHALRLVVGPDHRLLLPAAALGGAIFLVLADLGARMLFLALGTEPGVGVLTALVGAPFFLALLWRRRAGRLFVLVPLALVVGVEPGCVHEGEVAPPAATVEVTDDLGRVVEVPVHLERIVSLAPSTTEIVFALGAGNGVIGVDVFSDFPPEVAERRRLGSNLEPALESIVALEPDVVLTATTANSEGSVSDLERLGLPVYVTRSEDLGELYDTIEGVGELLGREEEAGALLARMRARLEAVRARVAGRPPVRTVIGVWHEPVMTVGPGTLPEELLHIAGGENLCADADSRFPRYPIERILRGAPEVIVVGSHGMDASIAYWKQWETLPAVAHGRVHAVDGNLLFRPGPRVVEAVEMLVPLLHPELGGASPGEFNPGGTGPDETSAGAPASGGAGERDAPAREGGAP